jgi:hypothetical protein
MSTPRGQHATYLKALLIVLIWICLVPSAVAETGDITISIHYRSKAVRVRPTPRIGGTDVDFMIVLHANGKVQDGYSVKGGKSGSSKSEMGPKANGVVYRVVDAGTITRTSDAGTHLYKITVRVSGKNCTANVEYILKPGKKEYRDFSTELGTMAYFSSLEATNVTCAIE